MQVSEIFGRDLTGICLTGSGEGGRLNSTLNVELSDARIGEAGLRNPLAHRPSHHSYRTAREITLGRKRGVMHKQPPHMNSGESPLIATTKG